MPDAEPGRGSGVDALVVAYGPDPAQFLELTLPDADGPRPVAVVLHGGFWRAAYGVELARPLARSLADDGFAAVAVEYRRGGAGGGRARAPGGGPAPPGARAAPPPARPGGRARAGAGRGRGPTSPPPWTRSRTCPGPGGWT